MGCGCLVAVLGLALPRFALFLMWIFGDRLSIVFDSFLVGFLGWLILPYTTFFYAVAYAPVAGVSGFGWFLVAMGFLMDLSSYFGGSGAERQRRRAGYA